MRYIAATLLFNACTIYKELKLRPFDILTTTSSYAPYYVMHAATVTVTCLILIYSSMSLHTEYATAKKPSKNTSNPGTPQKATQGSYK